MFAEILQKYIFTFNIFVFKKFIFNRFFLPKNFVIQTKIIYIQSISVFNFFKFSSEFTQVLREMLSTFTPSGFVLDCIIALDGGNLNCISRTDRTNDHFFTIWCRFIIGLPPEADLRLLQHLSWSS